MLIDSEADIDGRDGRLRRHAPGIRATVGSARNRGNGEGPDSPPTGSRWSARSSTPAPPETASGSQASRPTETLSTFSAATASPPTEPARAPSLELDEDGPSPSVGTGGMADNRPRTLERPVPRLARRLRLLGSLLHPQVHWTGVCTNSGEVLDWYRNLLAGGTTATVASVEVAGDAVVIGLGVARQAEGARPHHRRTPPPGLPGRQHPNRRDPQRPDRPSAPPRP